MLLKQVLIVALALTPIGCKEKSNTVEQNQSQTTGPGTGSGPQRGTVVDPNDPNPTHAGSGEPMGSAAFAPGAADNPPAPGDAGIDALTR